MHSASTALETLELLWENYLVLSEQVELESMPHEALEVHAKQGSHVRPFRIAGWLARQGYFIAAWCLWEFYARSLCMSLAHQMQEKRRPTIEWIDRSLAANGITFRERKWFEGANALRNLIAHHGSRTETVRAQNLLKRCRTSFPDIGTWKDGYVEISHCHVAELHLRIEQFIEDSQRFTGAVFGQ